MQPLDRSALCKLSPNDGNLLFARLGALTQPAPSTIVFAVVDTVGAARPERGHLTDPRSPDPWTLTYNTLTQARTGQLWLGELGDTDFETFCSSRHIALVRLTWPLLGAAATLKPFGSGGKILASRGLCERARARPALTFELVHDAERDELAREAYVLLGMIRARGHGPNWPEPIRTAYRLFALLARLACPLDVYERAAAIGSPVFNHSARAFLADIERAPRAAFEGPWTDVYDRYWHTLAGIARRLVRHAEGEPTKLHALFDLLVAAHGDGATLVVRCQTETERRAMRDTLQELDADASAEVVTYKPRAEAGPAHVLRHTILLSPPPPWQWSLLLSSEAGDVGSLVYPHELPKLRQAVTEAERAFDDDRDNRSALDALGIPSATGASWSPPPFALLAESPAFGTLKQWTDTEAQVEIPARENDDLWRELVDLWGSDLPEPDGGGALDAGLPFGYSGFARLVHFVNSPPVLLRDDRSVDVIVDAEGQGLDEVISKLPGQLLAGEHIAFLPGTEHHSLREALMSAWDDTLATERQLCEPLWRAAIVEAIEQHGLDGLAARISRHVATVRSWYEDRAAPQQAQDFLDVLKASANPAAWKARAPIWRFLQTTRTMHRLIGKKLRAAIGETLAGGPDQNNILELARLTHAPVGDLLDAAEELIVASVSPSLEVPLADCGRYLPADYSLLKAAP